MPTTSERRKAIPVGVKLQILIKQSRCAACGEKLERLDQTQFDHRPPLVAREWDEQAKDFVPPQNDPEHIEALHLDCHHFRTTGRRGEKKITSRGSDIGEAARTKRLDREHEEFRQRILNKGADLEMEADTLLRRNGFDINGKRKRQWPKRKMESRGWTQRSKRNGSKP